MPHALWFCDISSAKTYKMEPMGLPQDAQRPPLVLVWPASPLQASPHENTPWFSVVTRFIYRKLIVAVHIRWTSFGLLAEPSATSTTSLPRPAFLLTHLVPHCSAGCHCLLAASQCAAINNYNCGSTMLQFRGDPWLVTMWNLCPAGAPWISTNSWCHASNVALHVAEKKCVEDHESCTNDPFVEALQVACTSSMVRNGFGETYPFPKTLLSRWFSFSQGLHMLVSFPPRCADSTCCWIICFLRSRNLL